MPKHTPNTGRARPDEVVDRAIQTALRQRADARPERADARDHQRVGVGDLGRARAVTTALPPTFAIARETEWRLPIP